MLYNMNFEAAALAVLLLVLANVPLHNMVRTFSNKIFLAFLVCGIFNVVFDIASNITMSYPELYPRGVIVFTLQAYFLFQLCMPLLLTLYVLSLYSTPGRGLLPQLVLRGGGFVFMAGLVVLNPFTRALYYFDAAGVYRYGPWQYSTYVYAFLYLVLALGNVMRHRARIAPRDFAAVWQYAAINTSMLLLQMMFTRVMFIGVGICASLTVLVITANNPFSKMDQLTDLFAAEALREVLRDNTRRGHTVYPVAVALDNLKRINLVFGFDAGNRVLCECAARLAAIAGREDAFRLQGDTFIILLPSVAAQDTALADIRTMFAAPWDIERTPVQLSAAVCWMPDPGRCHGADALLDYLDYMLSCAKAHGAGTFLRDDDTLAAQYGRRKQIEAYLFTAMKENLFEVYLQPIYALGRERFVSAEALVRLRHPEFGMIPPAEFIPIAERSGEIARVERCIFQKLCDFLAENPMVAAKLETVKFNLSPASFLSEEPGRYLLREIDRQGLDPAFFQFEITETTATVYDDSLLNWAAGIKAAGAGLCLDDFGSGYANLDAVMKLPFDVVKIDRSLLLEADADPRAATLYTKLTDMLVGLGYHVLAEGAETEAEVEFLRAAGVQYIQGFYYAHPLPPAEFLQVMEGLDEVRERGGNG